MGAPAYLPLFQDDYLGDTQHLALEEHGAYFLLLLSAWRQPDCTLPNDDRKLARICRVSLRKWKAMRPALDEFWPIEGERIFNPRLRSERAYVDQKSNTNRKNAGKRWSKQVTENKQSGGMRPHSERNAPHPHSTTSPKGDVGDGGDFDPVKAIFESGHELLEQAGHGNATKRGRVIGGWRKRCADDTALLGMIEAAHARSPPPHEPVSWINSAIARHKERPHDDKHAPRDTRDGFTRAIDSRLSALDDQQPAASGRQ